MPINSPHRFARLVHNTAYTYAHLSDSHEDRLIELLDEGYSSGERIAEGEIIYGKNIIGTVPYAILCFIVAKEVVAIFVIDQGSVLADGDTNSDIFVLISLGMKQERHTSLL